MRCCENERSVLFMAQYKIFVIVQASSKSQLTKVVCSVMTILSL